MGRARREGKSGWRKVVSGRERIVAEGSRLLGDAGVKNPYGDGRAGERVVEGLMGTLRVSSEE